MLDMHTALLLLFQVSWQLGGTVALIKSKLYRGADLKVGDERPWQLGGDLCGRLVLELGVRFAGPPTLTLDRENQRLLLGS
jgi:hypothetical protein